MATLGHSTQKLIVKHSRVSNSACTFEDPRGEVRALLKLGQMCTPEFLHAENSATFADMCVCSSSLLRKLRSIFQSAQTKTGDRPPSCRPFTLKKQNNRNQYKRRFSLGDLKNVEPPQELEYLSSESLSLSSLDNLSTQSSADESVEDFRRNVISLVDFEEDQDTVRLVLEYCAGGDLLHYVQKNGNPQASPAHQGINSKQARLFFLQMARAMKHVHNNDMSHMDVSLENFLLAEPRPVTPLKHCKRCSLPKISQPNKGESQEECNKGEWTVKLADFGQASNRLVPAAPLVKAKRVPGKPFYSAPELWSLLDPGRSVSSLSSSGSTNLDDCVDGQKSDIFSLGICLVILLTGSPPWHKASTSDVTYRYFAKNSLRALVTYRQQLSLFDGGALGLLEQMVTSDPAKRISIDDVLRNPYCSSSS